MRRDGAINRERILLAAEAVFALDGSAASTEEVARRAGVGVATVFRHFPTKAELLEATALRYLERLGQDIRLLLDPPGPGPGPALASALRTLVAAGPTKVTLLNLLLTDAAGLSDAVLATVDTIRDELRRLLERAQAEGAARPDVTVEHLLTLARALAHVASPTDAGAVDAAVGIVLDGLGVAH